MNWLERLRARSHSRRPAHHDPTANAIARAVGTCPACGGALSGHRYAPFAVTRLTEARVAFAQDFERAFIAHEWASVRAFQDYAATEDAAEVVAMECPAGAVVMLLVRDPFELWADHSLHRAEVLSAEESAAVKRLSAPEAWRPL